MKKYLLLLTLCIPFTMLYAQKIRYGVEGGVNTTYISFKGDDGIENNGTGFQGGGTAFIPVSERLTIQPKLLYVQRTNRISHARFDIRQLELPVYLTYTKDGFMAGVGVGATYGLSARAHYKDQNEKVEYDLYKETDAELVLRRGGVTANIMMGYVFPNGISLNAHFSPIVTDMQKSGYTEAIYSKTIGFSVGYYIR